MCGFAGYLTHTPDKTNTTEKDEILHRMSYQLVLRAPDDERIVHSSNLSLVFRRLAIVDVAGGMQPIWNTEKTMFVVANGEIYNYKELRAQLEHKYQFHTKSDAEVILYLFAEYGIESLNYLNGMFAFAIWNSNTNTLLLVRDRLGIKPLYYYHNDGIFIFGSTLNALLAHPKVPNVPKWEDMTNLCVSSSYMHNIRRLPGGHYLVHSSTGEQSVHCYWTLSTYFDTSGSQTTRSASDYITEYQQLFDDSIQKQLMSDVPVGAFLSGGLDSSAIVAAASKYMSDLHCFTIVSDFTVDIGDAHAAQELSECLHLPFHPVMFNHETFIDDIQFSLEMFEYFIWLMDAPFFSVEYLLKHELHRYAKTILPDLKVILVGQGADEFAGGYSTPKDNIQSSWSSFIASLTKKEKDLSSIKQKVSESATTYIFDLLGSESLYFPSGSSVFQRDTLRYLAILQKYNLWHEDRSSSGQGVECRVPFLDHRLVEYLAAIPPDMQQILFWNKTIIREMATKWLPTKFAYRAKSYGSETDEERKLKHKILNTIFQDFQEKYISSSGIENFDSIKDKLCTLHKNACLDSDIGIYSMNTLIEIMAIMVFQDISSNRGLNIELHKFSGRSPLKECHYF